MSWSLLLFRVHGWQQWLGRWGLRFGDICETYLLINTIDIYIRTWRITGHQPCLLPLITDSRWKKNENPTKCLDYLSFCSPPIQNFELAKSRIEKHPCITAIANRQGHHVGIIVAHDKLLAIHFPNLVVDIIVGDAKSMGIHFIIFLHWKWKA